MLVLRFRGKTDGCRLPIRNQAVPAQLNPTEAVVAIRTTPDDWLFHGEVNEPKASFLAFRADPTD